MRPSVSDRSYAPYGTFELLDRPMAMVAVRTRNAYCMGLRLVRGTRIMAMRDRAPRTSQREMERFSPLVRRARCGGL